MATDFLVKQGRVMGGVRLVTDADVAHQTDLTNIRETGTTASQAISAGTYFYLNGTLVRAKVAIANGATFTLNTNYEVVTAGGLNELASKIATINSTISGKIVKRANKNVTTTADGYITINKTDCPHVISVCPITRAALTFVYQANATQWVVFFREAGTLALITSTQINADIFYTD